jgi:hypothetical protein
VGAAPSAERERRHRQPQDHPAESAGGIAYSTIFMPLTRGGSTDLRFFLPLSPAARQLRNPLAQWVGGVPHSTIISPLSPATDGNRTCATTRIVSPAVGRLSAHSGSSHHYRPPLRIPQDRSVQGGRRSVHSTIVPPIAAAAWCSRQSSHP